MYLAGGTFRGRRILERETIERMWTPEVSLWTLREEGYGFAFATETYKGLTLVRHNGGGRGSYGSCFYLAPSRGQAVIALANWPALLPLVRGVFDAVFALPPTAPARARPAARDDHAARSRLAGSYLGHLTGLVEIRQDDDAMILSRNGKAFTLQPIRKQQYEGRAADGERISLGVPGDNELEPATFIVVDDGPCERIAPPALVPPDPALWSTFAGTYRLPDCALVNDPSFTVALTGDALTLTWRGVTVPCIALDVTHLACDFGQIAFLTSSDGPQLELWRTMTARRV